LSAAGRADSRTLAARLEAFLPAQLFFCDEAKAQETAEIVAAQLNLNNAECNPSVAGFALPVLPAFVVGVGLAEV
jgi:phosphohistidine phosphatase SixA